MAPDAGGFFVGDYQGMAVDRDGGTFHTLFGQTSCNSTACPSVGVPAPDTGTSPTPGARNDPFDVYTTLENARDR